MKTRSRACEIVFPAALLVAAGGFALAAGHHEHLGNLHRSAGQIWLDESRAALKMR
jgi:hypothetical protein